MAEVIAPETAKRPRKPRTKKHIAPPATAEEISRAVGVTKRDEAIVRKVMMELGYLGTKVKMKPSLSRKGSSRASEG